MGFFHSEVPAIYTGLLSRITGALYMGTNFGSSAIIKFGGPGDCKSKSGNALKGS